MMRHDRRPPRGSALLEMLVALPIVALIGTLAVRVLLASQALVADTAARDGAQEALRHLGAVLQGELDRLGPAQLRAWRDGFLEIESTVAVGTLCAYDTTRTGAPRTIAIAGNAPRGPLARDTTSDGAWFSATPEATDRVWALADAPLVTDAQHGDRRGDQCWRVGAPLAITRRGCSTSSVPFELETAATWRDASGVTPTMAGLVLGGPVLITRRARIVLYRSGDGSWTLGRSTWNGATWDVTQPVGGALLSLADGGFTIRVYDRLGQAVRRDALPYDVLAPVSGDVPTRVDFVLRARRTNQRQRTVGAGTVDSLRVRHVFGTLDRAAGGAP